jgi:hypothetical protein
MKSTRGVGSNRPRRQQRSFPPMNRRRRIPRCRRSLVSTNNPRSRVSNQDCHRQSVTRARKQRHEQSLAGVLPPACRLCGEEAAGCGDRASPTEPVATGHCRNHQTLCHSRARKRQHGNLPLSGRDHRDRFKDGAHDATLQENERRTVRPAPRKRITAEAPPITSS